MSFSVEVWCAFVLQILGYFRNNGHFQRTGEITGTSERYDKLSQLFISTSTAMGKGRLLLLLRPCGANCMTFTRAEFFEGYQSP